jgi:hypothetical protein
MSVSLLEFLQKDVENPAQRLTVSPPTPLAWGHTLKEYLDDLTDRYRRASGTGGMQRRVAAGCLNLAAACAQAGAALASADPWPSKEIGRRRSAGGRKSAFVGIAILLAILILNMVLSSLTGSLSVLAILALFLVYLYKDGLFAHRAGAAESRTDKPLPPGIAAISEEIVRRTDAILHDAEPPPPLPLPLGVTSTTLEFFQDLVEAKINGDPEYAFRMMSFAIDRVLAAEGVEAAADADAKPELFVIDVVPGTGEDRTVVSRPAFSRNSICLLRGYARRFATEQRGA